MIVNKFGNLGGAVKYQASSAQPSKIRPLYYVFIVPQPVIIRLLTR